MGSDATKRYERFRRAVLEDGRYPLEAYEFLNHGLEYTTNLVHVGESDGPRHVTGQELSAGLRDLAIQRWGGLAPLVLKQWGIRSTRDFGEMVFFLVGLNLMGAHESDSIDDFDGVFNFDEAFGGYRIDLDRTASDPTA